jgi:hypothetical protein
VVALAEVSLSLPSPSLYLPYPRLPLPSPQLCVPCNSYTPYIQIRKAIKLEMGYNIRLELS